MRKLYALLLLIISITSFGQAPQLIPYQAIARDAAGQALANASINARFTIHDETATGTTVWQEIQTVTTTALGLFTAQLGSNVSLGSVNWASGSKFMQVEIDLGSGFVEIGTQQMLSVPYALQSNKSGYAETSGVSGNGISNISIYGDTLYLSNGSHVIVPGISVANGPRGCTDIYACNYNSAATQDDGSCYSYGCACDDGNEITINDTWNLDCVCEGSTVDTSLLNIHTVLIPAGTFNMGSPSDEEQRGSDEQLHSVTLSSFRMSRHEITNAQFVTFLNESNIGNEQSYLLGSSSAVYYACTKWAYIPGKENYPVVGVSWLGATEFASFVGGRLPTESEWEYACRGNTNTPFNTGNCLDYSQANYRWDFSYSGCSNENTNYIFDGMPVNSYSPNSYGLYNMHGNAGEWCSDWYGPYSLDSQVNPIGPQSGNQKVLRGGGFGTGAQYCRSASRNPLPTTGLIANDAGFRVVFNP